MSRVDWKEKSGGAIIHQLKRLGASADWSRERFTMDDRSNENVRQCFVKLYKDGLIYKDKRLVNWDVKYQTAISDVEVIQKEIKIQILLYCLSTCFGRGTYHHCHNTPRNFVWGCGGCCASRR
ncbi:MAG: class I tRNA ligase family protein [Holosporaceae bacterium]|nr:MAG: class I tRNA ligase family protein [Holosporaceae bacterium]